MSGHPPPCARAPGFESTIAHAGLFGPGGLLWHAGLLGVAGPLWHAGLLGVAGLLGLAACSVPPPASPPPVVSLLGDTLVPPPLPNAAALEADLDSARAAYDADPSGVAAAVWLGRRTAYLWRYREAVDIYTEGLARNPGEPHLLRHRGHRYITVRDFTAAERDLSAAAAAVEGLPDEIEPDGQPNAAGIPTSTLQTNIQYHLGLALYLQGRFDEAAAAFTRCRALATNDDMRVAAADWEYMALRRAGRHAEADAAVVFVTPGLPLLENHAYHRRILMYRGLVPPDSLLDAGDPLDLATQGYGVGNWFLADGDTARAMEIFRNVLAGEYWAAFGFIAAEADVARFGK